MAVRGGRGWSAAETPENYRSGLNTSRNSYPPPGLLFGPAPATRYKLAMRKSPCFNGMAILSIFPGGAVHLARSQQCENQAFRFGDTAYGLQFHMEVTARNHRRLALRRGQLRRAGGIDLHRSGRHPPADARTVAADGSAGTKSFRSVCDALSSMSVVRCPWSVASNHAVHPKLIKSSQSQRTTDQGPLTTDHCSNANYPYRCWARSSRSGRSDHSSRDRAGGEHCRNPDVRSRRGVLVRHVLPD